jgi:hypothetical protein
MIITEQERGWLNTMALKNHTTISSMLIELLDQKSKELGVPLPLKRKKRIPHRQTHIDFMKREKDKYEARKGG